MERRGKMCSGAMLQSWLSVLLVTEYNHFHTEMQSVDQLNESLRSFQNQCEFSSSDRSSLSYYLLCMLSNWLRLLQLGGSRESCTTDHQSSSTFYLNEFSNALTLLTSVPWFMHTCSTMCITYMHGWDFSGYSWISGFRYVSKSNKNYF